MTFATLSRTGGLREGLDQLFLQMKGDFSTLAWRDTAAAIALAGAMFAFSAWRIDFSYTASTVNNCIFGADSITFWRWLQQGNYFGVGFHKHSLSVLALAVLAQPLVWLGVPMVSAVIAAFAAIWAGVSVTTFLYFRKAGLGTGGALTVAVLALSSFAIATHSSIAETYGTTLLAISAACILLPSAAALAPTRPMLSALLAGAIGAGLALANAPSAAFLVIYFFCLPLPLGEKVGTPTSQLVILAGIPALAVCTAIALPALLAEGAAGARWHSDYFLRYADIANLSDPRRLADFLVSVFVFAFVAPREFIQCRFILSDLAGFISNPTRLVAALLILSMLVSGIARSLRSSRRRETLGLLTAILMLIAFYLVFNPDEALLYSPQWTLALFFAASPRFSLVTLWAGGAAAASLAVNLPPLHHPRTYDPEQCCPHKPSSMLPRETPAALKRQMLEREAKP